VWQAGSATGTVAAIVPGALDNGGAIARLQPAVGAAILTAGISVENTAQPPRAMGETLAFADAGELHSDASKNAVEAIRLTPIRLRRGLRIWRSNLRQ